MDTHRGVILTLVDFSEYHLEQQVDRVPAYDFGLDKIQEERVEELITKNVIISLHEHLNVFPKGQPPARGRRRQFIGYEGLHHSGMDAGGHRH